MDACVITNFHSPLRLEVHIQSSLDDFFPFIFIPKRVVFITIKLSLRVLCDIERRLSESMLLTVLNVLSTFEFEPEIDSTRLAILHRFGNSSRQYVRTDYHSCFALGDLEK